jgi:nucleoid-associated protein YejK
VLCSEKYSHLDTNKLAMGMRINLDIYNNSENEDRKKRYVSLIRGTTDISKLLLQYSDKQVSLPNTDKLRALKLTVSFDELEANSPIFLLNSSLSCTPSGKLIQLTIFINDVA